MISNPPYVAADDAAAGRGRRLGARCRPGGRPDRHSRRCATWSPRPAAWLARPGALVLELAPHQADDVAAAALEVGFDEVTVGHDLAGRRRALVARLRGGRAGSS